MQEPEMRERVIKILWEKQFEGSPWHDKFHLIRPDSLEGDMASCTGMIIECVNELIAQRDNRRQTGR